MEYLTNNTNNQFLFNDQGELIDGISSLPTELSIRIFSLLPKKDLTNSSLTSKSWKDLSEDKELWKQTAQDLNINECDNYRIAIGEKIEELKKIAKKEYDMPEMLDECFNANLLLTRVGLASMDTVKKIAEVSREKFGSETGWLKIASEMVSIGKYDEALQIVDSKLRYKKINILKEIIYKLIYVEKKFEDAIKIYKDYSDDVCLVVYDKRTKYVLDFAFKNNKYDAIENLIDEYIPNNNSFPERLKTIVELLEKLLIEKNEQKVKMLIEKYKNDLEKPNDYGESLIKIYIQIGYNEKAWDMVLNYKNRHIIYTLRDAFFDYNLKEEGEKVATMIEKFEKNSDWWDYSSKTVKDFQVD